ncbi:vitamin B12 ABC transporter substrate-binding protein BtuF [Ewingella americana]|nr:vitamin B12 ABC transporter substrate-binding protein BtuF [Ewingella americana]
MILCLWLPMAAIAQPAQRVISLAPNLTELAYAAGLGDKLVGVSAYSDFPPEAKGIEQVASWQGVNVERILALKPDLVLAWRGGNPQRPLEQLSSLGIQVLYLDPESIEQIAQTLEQLSGYSSNPKPGQDAATKLRQQRDQLKQQYTRSQPLPVLVQFGTQPLFSVSKATLQSEVVSLCGGKNIFAESRAPWPQVSREQVLVRQPRVIVITGDKQQKQTISQFWQPALNVPVVNLNADWFSRAGPRIIMAAQQLCTALQPIDSE